MPKYHLKPKVLAVCQSFAQNFGMCQKFRHKILAWNILAWNFGTKNLSEFLAEIFGSNCYFGKQMYKTFQTFCNCSKFANHESFWAPLTCFPLAITEKKKTYHHKKFLRNYVRCRSWRVRVFGKLLKFFGKFAQVFPLSFFGSPKIWLVLRTDQGGSLWVGQGSMPLPP